jgi:hypothetical protein
MADRESGPSFVARIWIESGPGEERVWRGHIRHVQSGRAVYFQGLDRMNAFMDRIAQNALALFEDSKQAQLQRRNGKEDWQTGLEA